MIHLLKRLDNGLNEAAFYERSHESFSEKRNLKKNKKVFNKNNFSPSSVTRSSARLTTALME